MNKFFLALRSSFGFLSTIPVGITMEGLDEFFKRTYLHIIVGTVLGILMGIFGYISIHIFPTVISAVLIVFFIYYLTGLNHLDGLADFGDGTTAHGSVEKKLRALKDVALGIGGVGFCTIEILALYATIVALQNEAVAWIGIKHGALILFAALVVAEVCAMQCMLTIAAFGKPLHEGLGSILIEKTTMAKYTIGLIIAILICAFVMSMVWIWYIGIIALVCGIISAFIVLNISNRHFKGVNGDVIGTSNEVGRIIALMSMVVILHFYNGGIVWML